MLYSVNINCTSWLKENILIINWINWIIFEDLTCWRMKRFEKIYYFGQWICKPLKFYPVNWLQEEFERRCSESINTWKLFYLSCLGTSGNEVYWLCSEVLASPSSVCLISIPAMGWGPGLVPFPFSLLSTIPVWWLAGLTGNSPA